MFFFSQTSLQHFRIIHIVGIILLTQDYVESTEIIDSLYVTIITSKLTQSVITLLLIYLIRRSINQIIFLCMVDR